MIRPLSTVLPVRVPGWPVGVGQVMWRDSFVLKSSPQWRWKEKGTAVVGFSANPVTLCMWLRTVISNWMTAGPNPEGLARSESSLEMRHDAESQSASEGSPV